MMLMESDSILVAYLLISESSVIFVHLCGSLVFLVFNWIRAMWYLFVSCYSAYQSTIMFVRVEEQISGGAAPSTSQVSTPTGEATFEKPFLLCISMLVSYLLIHGVFFCVIRSLWCDVYRCGFILLLGRVPDYSTYACPVLNSVACLFVSYCCWWCVHLSTPRSTTSWLICKIIAPSLPRCGDSCWPSLPHPPWPMPSGLLAATAR